MNMDNGCSVDIVVLTAVSELCPNQRLLNACSSIERGVDVNVRSTKYNITFVEESGG